MKYNLTCRLCQQGSYEALSATHNADVHNLQLGLQVRRDGLGWIVLRCSTCGNIMVCDPTTG
jgi:hypothetical protein